MSRDYYYDINDCFGDIAQTGMSECITRSWNFEREILQVMGGECDDYAVFLEGDNYYQKSLLGISNYKTACELLNVGKGNVKNIFEWCHGGLDCLVVRIKDKNGRMTSAFKRVWELVIEPMQNYPVLDDEDYSNLEQEAAIENYMNEMGALDENLASMILSHFWETNNHNCYENSDDSGAWASEEDLLNALAAILSDHFDNDTMTNDEVEQISDILQDHERAWYCNDCQKWSYFLGGDGQYCKECEGEICEKCEKQDYRVDMEKTPKGYYCMECAEKTVKEWWLQ